jgi:uncharacterized protein YfaS (alpha-2-macroglobulin family)
VRWLSKHLIGQWDWEPPAWNVWLTKRIRTGIEALRADWRIGGAFALALVLSVGGYEWYRHRPRPHYIDVKITAPGRTEWDDNGRKPPKPLLVDFAESAAPLKNIEKPVPAGITLSPAFGGTWVWVSDKQLRFTPKDDWPVGTRFTIRLAKKGLLTRDALLEDYNLPFSTAPFTAKVTSAEFYQDPRDPSLKRAVTTLEFSHPVDTERLEKSVSIALEKDAEYLGLKTDSRNYTVVYDKFKLTAAIYSVPLALPRDDTKMTVTVGKGLRAMRGGNETPEKLLASVVIPGRGSLRFSEIQMTLVDNERYEPKQVLLVRSSSPVTEKAIAGKVEAWVLPVRSPQQPKEDPNPWEWNQSEVGGDILKQSRYIKLDYQPSESPGNSNHGFHFDAPVGRYVFVLVREGVEGTGGYISTKPFTAVFQVAPYPKALKFLGEGSLLSLSGDKKVGFMVRDIDKVDVEVGRVLPNQIQHLAPLMWDYSHPGIYADLSNKLVERWNVARDYTGKPAGKPTRDSIDLSTYLKSKNGMNRGLFLLQIREDTSRPQYAAAEADADGEGEGEGDGGDGEGGSFGSSTLDNRLILVTDLGMIVKHNKDDSREVFVQSIRTGAPVDGARVSLLGANGEPVAAASTDSTGHATLPKFAREWKREKLPEIILVEKADDFSFLPLRSNGRDLDVSRFDVGGAVSAKSAQELSAYLFTDRGIYRPGETAHLEAIVRTGDWKASLTGLPVKFEISDSRGTIVSRNELKLSPAAFESIDFTSTSEAPTGTWQAMMYLVKGPNNRDELLGSTSFRVQEFEPDRMKVRLDLSDNPVGASSQAWLRPSEVKGRVTASLLSGEPAVNRRVEGEVSLVAALPAFSRWSDHRFQVAEFQNEPYKETLAGAVTDDKGAATLTLDLDRFTGKAYRLSMLARVYEAGGGRNVAAQNSVIVSDSPYLIGVKPDGDLYFVRRDTTRAAHWLAVNQQLDPVEAGDLTLEWVQRKYVSVLTEQANKTYKYVSRLKEVVRDTRKINIPRGGVNIPLRTNEPGDFVYVLRDSSGAEINKLTYSVAGDANLSRSLDRNAELEIRLNKKDYAAGETIDVAIRAPYIGAGLITIERDKVYAHRWFRTSTTSSVQHIQVPADFEGSGYVSVQFTRDPSSNEIFLSPLSYGVAPFAGNLAVRTEPLTLNAPRQIKPGETLNMHVAPGAAARVAVVAVDEGILQVARYRNPDPVGYFFQKRMLEVGTSQILDLILPEFRKFLALAAPGGDADGGYARHLNPFQRKRKPPVAWWSGIVDVGPGGHDFQYVVPDYFNGKVRVIAIAVTPSRIGVQESGTEVKGDFLLTPNVPAVVGPGDELIITSGVYDNTTNGKGPIHIEVQHGAELANVSAGSVDIDPAGKKEVTAEFRLRANDVPGPASLRIVARRGAATARTEESVGIRPPVPFRTQLTLGRSDAARTPLAVTRNLYQNLRKVEAAVSTVPLVWGQGLILWLGDYPYLCTEQLTSKGVGVMLSVTRPEFGIQKPTQPLSSVISAIGARQNDQGGLGLWTSVPETAEFPTIYAAQFLIEAREHGQRVPPELLDRLNDWMQRFASSPAPTLDGGRNRAYAVYLLARQGLKPAPAISNVEQELSKRYTKDWPTDLAAAYLASTYRLLQRNDDAERIISKVSWSQQKNAWTGFDYYSPTVHNAALLYLEAMHFPNRLPNVPRAVLDDMAKASMGRGLSSLDAASILLALDAYAKSAATGTKFGIAEVGRDGQVRQLPLPAGAMPRVAISENTARLLLSKEGPQPQYYSLNESGFDRNPPTNSIQQGLEILHDFVDASGNPIQRIRSGDEFFVRTRFRTLKSDYVSVAVVDMLPGGVEPVIELRPPADSSAPGVDAATRGPGTSVAGLPIGVPEKTTWQPQFADVRDDRVVLYGTATKQTATFTYRVRATNPGTFQTPPAFAEGMYDRTIAGQSAASKLEVTKP